MGAVVKRLVAAALLACTLVATSPTLQAQDAGMSLGPPPSASVHAPRTIRYVLSGAIAQADVPMMVQALTQARLTGARLVVDIDSEGGSVPAAHTIVKLIDMAVQAGIDVRCVADGNAQSAAFYVLQACPLRYMTKRSILMTHQPRVDMQVWPLATDEEIIAWIRQQIDEVRVLAKAFQEHAGRRMKVTPAEYAQRTARGKAWFMGWQDALRYGAVDFAITSVDELTVR